MPAIHKRNIYCVLLLWCCAGFFLSAQRTPRVGSKPIEKNGEAWLVAIVQENVQGMRNHEMGMWECYYVYAEYEKRCYLGIHDPEELDMTQALGWVDKDCLLTSATAERTEKKIYRKVIAFDNKEEKRVHIYAAPKPGAGEIGKAPMFAFFYIYKEVESYYLIGLSSHTWIEDAGNDILGWIEKKSCREWNTRQAISYKSETRDARLAREKENQPGLVSIYKASEDATKQNPEGVIDRETEETTWYYNTPRYPLLSSDSVDQKRLFQIAFLGGKKSSNTPHLVAKMREKRQKLAQVDVMFLVDSSLTDSDDFRDYLVQALKNAFGEFCRNAEKQRGLKPDLFIGITFYSDFNDRIKYRYKRGQLFEPRVIHVHPLNNNISQFEQNVKNEHRWGASHSLDRRSLFYAIDSAVQDRARWRDGSQRYLIVVGTTGNHETGADPKKNVSQLALEEVKEALRQSETAIYAVHVLDAATLENPNVLAFRDQMSDLVDKRGRGGYISVFKTPPESGGQKDMELSTLLSALLEQCREEYKLVQDTLSDMEYGFPPDDAKKRHEQDWQELWKKFSDNLVSRGITAEKRLWKIVNPDIAAVIERFIATANVDRQELQAQGTFYDRGWVWEFHPDTNLQQAQVWLLIDKLELSRLAYFLSSLHSELKNASKPEQYLEVWKTLLRTTFGIDTIPISEPIDNLIQQHTGLPFINGLLSYSLEDFVKKSQSATFRQSVLKDLDTTCTHLFEILKEQEQESITYADGTKISGKKKRWWQEKGSDVEYAWIEVEMFP